MGQWWLLLLIASQAALRHSAVDATFDVGLGWLRGDTSLFYSVVNTTTTTETAVPQSTLQDVANTTTTAGALNGRRTSLSISTTHTAPTETAQFVDPTTTTTEASPQDIRSEPASPATTAEATTGTTAGTSPTTTPFVIENATLVSLDELVLDIGKVQDPVLHLVQNEDGSSSYVVVSGRLGPTTMNTTAATTAAASTTPTTGTTSPPTRNETSASYQTLLAYLRPWILGRLFLATTASSAVTTPSPVTTASPPATPARTPGPATTPTMAARMFTRTDLDSTNTPPTTSGTGTQNHGLVMHTTEDPATTTLFPAEFRVTEFRVGFAHTEATASISFTNATIAGSTVPSPVQPATQIPAKPTTADPATTVASDATATPPTASTKDVFMGTNAAFPVQTTPTASMDGPTTAGPVGRTEAGAPEPIARTPSQPDKTTATLVTTLPPLVGDLREESLAPWSTTASPTTSFPSSNQTFGVHGRPSSTTARTTAEEPAYRFFYDPREVTQTL